MHLLTGVIAVIALAGCGGQGSGSARSRTASANLPGCTDTWTGSAGDSDYTNAANWSRQAIPAPSDNACLPPGSVVVVRRAPPQAATSLLNEGTLCLGISPGALARSLTNGSPNGHRSLAVLADLSSPACSPGMPAQRATPRLVLTVPDRVPTVPEATTASPPATRPSPRPRQNLTFIPVG